MSDQSAAAVSAFETITATETTTGFGLFSDHSIVAMRIDGKLLDLAATVSPGDVVEPIVISSADGLAILRHSAAHVAAQAMQSINPEAKLGIGPPIVDGFYYDFDVETPLTPEDLKAVDKAMERIIRQGQRFVRRVVTEDDLETYEKEIQKLTDGFVKKIDDAVTTKEAEILKV